MATRADIERAAPVVVRRARRRAASEAAFGELVAHIRLDLSADEGREGGHAPRASASRALTVVAAERVAADDAVLLARIVAAPAPLALTGKPVSRSGIDAPVLRGTREPAVAVRTSFQVPRIVPQFGCHACRALPCHALPRLAPPRLPCLAAPRCAGPCRARPRQACRVAPVASRREWCPPRHALPYLIASFRATSGLANFFGQAAAFCLSVVTPASATSASGSRPSASARPRVRSIDARTRPHS